MTATHVHEDTQEHLDDCKICVIVKAFSNVDVPKFDLLFSCEKCIYVIETFASFIQDNSILKGFFSHAPPVLFL